MRPTPNPRASSEGDEGRPTQVMSAVELDDVIPDRTSGPDLGTNRIDYDPVDDGWGPPGTTIPPPLLGAVPGSDEEDGGAIVKGIPISMDSAPRSSRRHRRPKSRARCRRDRARSSCVRSRKRRRDRSS
jgi:hypothetical protein